VGVSTVDNEDQLHKALELAAKYEGSVLIEKRIFGREFTQGFLGGVALPPVEIIPKCGFYDYANKYVANATEEICPASLTDDELKRISEATAKGFAALRLIDYARFDYILDSDGIFWCLEANTLPGMTPTSLLPQEAAAIGIDYDSLCDKLANMALAKKKKHK
jgi:D-alanine-D-alanine ligase